ncbi:MAG: ATP-binding protein [Candidatus Aenigmarchaeota archaeon]|nr:ATP-binding protein [Candidatus Aenigmarchaeota archaeon]
MRIAVIGTHSTGKTEFCKEIYDQLSKTKKVGFVSELTRKCPFPINENTSIKAQLWILANQIKEEQEKEDQNDVVICDRGLVDHFIYLIRKFPEYGELLSKFITEYSKGYDIIFKTEIDETKPIIDDGFRSIDSSFRKEIDDMLIDFLNNHDIDHVPIKNDLDFVMDKVMKCLK